MPLVYSNPKLYPRPLSTDALVSHVDFLPTLASLAEAPVGARADWQGVDYSSLVLRPGQATSGAGLRRLHLRRLPVGPEQPALPETAQPHRQHPRRALEAGQVLRLRRAAREPQWEMYDLRRDPLEKRNIAYPGHERTPTEERKWRASNASSPGSRKRASSRRPARAPERSRRPADLQRAHGMGAACRDRCGTSCAPRRAAPACCSAAAGGRARVGERRRWPPTRRVWHTRLSIRHRRRGSRRSTCATWVNAG